MEEDGTVRGLGTQLPVRNMSYQWFMVIACLLQVRSDTQTGLPSLMLTARVFLLMSAI